MTPSKCSRNKISLCRQLFSYSSANEFNKAMLTIPTTIRLCVPAIAGIFLLSAAVPAINAQDNALFFTSSPQSWVGHGETGLVLGSEGTIFIGNRNVYGGVSFRIIGASDPTHLWNLDFNAPNRALLIPGNYLGAIRYPSYPPSLPGLSFSYDARGDNYLTGYFTVLALQFTANNELQTFAADFVQYDEGNLDWWNQGSIRYNSTLPIPEPATSYSVLFGGAILLMRMFGRARR